MPLSWNEIKSRALTFSRTWADAANEDSEAKPFWIAFFEIFGITDKRVATFELNVKKLGAAQGFVDLFWPGMRLVEHKSRGKDLDRAFEQALDYFPGLPERDLPQIIIVCDFARFRVHQLATGQTTDFTLQDLHQHVKLFGFVAGYKAQTIKAQDPVNIKAAERMGRLHDALKASGYSGHPRRVRRHRQRRAAGLCGGVVRQGGALYASLHHLPPPIPRGSARRLFTPLSPRGRGAGGEGAFAIGRCASTPPLPNPLPRGERG
jgi:hypothetical protein